MPVQINLQLFLVLKSIFVFTAGLAKDGFKRVKPFIKRGRLDAICASGGQNHMPIQAFITRLSRW